MVARPPSAVASRKDAQIAPSSRASPSWGPINNKKKPAIVTRSAVAAHAAAALLVARSGQVLPDHLEDVAALSVQDGLERIHGHPISRLQGREGRHHEFEWSDVNIE